MKSIFLLVPFLLIITYNCLGGVTKPIKGNLFILSIGVDKYKKPFPNFVSCEQDANKLFFKLQDDYKRLYEDYEDFKGEIFSFILTNENANRDSIKKVFEYISKNSLPNDYFVFIFSGITLEDKKGETSLYPFINSKLDSLPESLIDSNIITLNTLGKWANGIQCNNQLFISESGSGTPFATNLINNLFESNMIIASQSKRNRIIITTNGFGMDSYKCQAGNYENGGPLCHFLINLNNILEIFVNQNKIEYELLKTEIQCNPFDGSKIYSVIYKERDFNKLLSNKFQTRGMSLLQNESEDDKDREIKNYAIIVATNEYNDKAEWSYLKNPGNDAMAVQTLLKDKYNYEILFLYNKSLDSVTASIINFKKHIGINDNVFIFFAGHGYYDKDYSDCYIVFTDSRPLKEDFRRTSYLPMATLNRILDDYPNKNLFVIFDICFGAYFDFNAKDLSLNDYKNVSFDISLDAYIKRKSEYTSRIYLSSGKSEVPDYWTNSLNHSPFANKLIEILEKEILFLTPGKIYSSLEGNITEPILKQFGKHDTRGDFIMEVK